MESTLNTLSELSLIADAHPRNMNLAFPVDDAPLAVPNPERSSILHRSLSNKPLLVSSGKGSYLHLDDGREILDACSGAAVACIGHGDERVTTAMMEQMAKVSYVHAQIYTSRPAEDLADLLVKSTDGKMSHVLFMSSGTACSRSL